MTDEEIRARLLRIEQESEALGEWQARFINEVCRKYGGPLTPKQRRLAEVIMEECR